MTGSNLFTKYNDTLWLALDEENGLAMFAKCLGVPPVIADVFEHGCLVIQTDSGTGTHAIYENVGSISVPSWSLLGGGGAMAIGQPVTGGTPTAVLYVDAAGNLAQDPPNFWYDPVVRSLTVGSPTSVLNGLSENAFNVNGYFGGPLNPDYLAISNHNSSPYGSTDHIVSNDIDDGTVLTGTYGDFGIGGSQYAVIGQNMIQPNDVYLYASPGANNLAIFTTRPGSILRLGTSGDTFDASRVTIADDITVFYANKDVEIIPTFVAPNWTAAGGWSVSGATLVLVSDPGPNTIEPSTPLTIVPGVTYNVIIESTGTSGVISYTLGGVPGTLISSGTTEDFLTALTTGNLIITGAASATGTIDSISIRALIPNTGQVEVQGDLILGGGISTISGTSVATIDGSGVVTFSQIPFVPVALPTQPYQVANKYYVDTFSQGLIPYLDCDLATTVNIVLSGEQTIDGVLTSTSRVLVKDQILQKDNGIYITGAGAWTRTVDFDATPEIKMGAFFYITNGTNPPTGNKGDRYAQYLFNPASDTLGVDPIGFTIISQAGFGLTSFSFNNANGFSGVVTSPSTTPNLTLTTTITGMVRGSGGALTAAGTGTDNHIIRYDGNDNIQNSDLTISDVSGGIVTISSPSAIYFNTTSVGYEFEIDSGGDINLYAGMNVGGGQGFSINAAAGTAGPNGLGGNYTSRAGQGGSTLGRGGHNYMFGGDADPFGLNSDGGDTVIAPGNKSGTGVPGKMRFYNNFGANWSGNFDFSAVAAGIADKTFSWQALNGTVALLQNNLGAFSATTSAQLASIISDETGTGALVFANTPTLVTPNIGAATGTSLAVTGGLTSNGTAGIGYATGAGGQVTQLTNKATAVTLNKITGRITMNGANLANNAIVSFTLNNSTIGATDIPYVFMSGVGTIGGYTVEVTRRAAGSCSISVRNISGGALAQAIVLDFIIFKGVIA